MNLDITTLRPEENLIGFACQELRKRIQRLIDDGKTHIIIDMSDIELMDSSAIGMILGIQNILLSKGGKLQIRNLSEDIISMLKSIYLDRHIEIIE